MTTITVTRWREGFNKVAFTKLLHDRAGMKLAAAKRHTDQILAGDTVVVDDPRGELARALSQEISRLGVDVSVGESERSVDGTPVVGSHLGPALEDAPAVQRP